VDDIVDWLIDHPGQAALAFLAFGGLMAGLMVYGAWTLSGDLAGRDTTHAEFFTDRSGQEWECYRS
jgi:hypothetical protein